MGKESDLKRARRGAIALARARMRGVLARHLPEPLWDGPRPLWGRGRRAVGREQLQRRSQRAKLEKLRADLTPDHLGKKRWDGIAGLPLLREERAGDRHVVRERLQPAELTHREPAILPVEGPRRRARLRLNRPGGKALGELEKERPVAATPAEERQAAPPIPLAAKRLA